MNKNTLKKILEHPDKDEIISKLVIGISSKEIYEWLSEKYTNPSEKKFIISEKDIKGFQSNYLDIYSMIREDLSKTKQALALNTEDQVILSIQNNPTYKGAIIDMATSEVDVRKIIARLCVAVETRLAQVFDKVQEDPNNVNTKIDRLLIDYTEVLGNILEKYYKFTEAPADQVVHHNVTLQVVDQHITVFHDVIKEVLAQMDLESSLYFMEIFHEKMSQIKHVDIDKDNNKLTTEVKLAEAQLLNETINKKINE